MTPVEFLKKNDPILASIIPTFGNLTLDDKEDHLESLVSTIISQQLSWKVYATIKNRLFTKLKNKITAKNILELPDSEYRECGISASKTSYIKNVANFSLQNQEFFKNIHKISDEEITNELLKIKGIGIWSVQMFLIFHLSRLDIFPLNDLGIRSAIKKLYNFKNIPTDKQMLNVSKKWGKYRSIACLYLWKYQESHKPVRKNTKT